MADILIKIASSLHARGFDADERVHHKAYERVTSLIDGQLQRAEAHTGEDYLKCKSKEDFVRYYNTISILGERGIGKTSFLMSLREEYKKEEKKVVMLPLIDPTLFEEKGHLFLLIISLIDEALNGEVEKGMKAEKQPAFEKYQKIKCQLAQGLPTLDQEGLTYTEPQWHEDEYMMIRGLESVKAAFHLERNFHHLVHLALEVLDAKAFMLMFDDIDVDFKKGWMVLETLRKFLTTPQLIILLSGNMKLYSKNVRKQQWRNFGKELLKNEMETSDMGLAEYARLVNEIEGQYMQKVLKSENRVFLYSMNENFLIQGDKYKVQYAEKEESIPLLQAYQQVFQENGVKGTLATSLFTAFMMSTSMRTQIHFLYTMKHVGQHDLMSKISAFTSRMYAQNIDVGLMTSCTQYNLVLLHYLLEQNILEEAYLLIPNFESKDVNSALVGFSFVFSHLVKANPFLIFDYWNRIGMTKNHMRYLSYDKDSDHSVGRYCTSVGVYHARDLRSLVGNGLAFLSSLDKNYIRREGMIALMGFREATKGKGRELNNRIDSVFSQATGLQRVLGYLPLLSLLYDDRNGRVLYYSFYSLLAAMGQVLKAEGEELQKQAIRAACSLQGFQVRSDSMYSQEEAADFVSDTEIQVEEETISQIAHAVSYWKNRYADLKIDYGNYLFGRIFTRLYDSLANIAENNKNEPLGNVFSLFVADLINACLIEESQVCSLKNEITVNHNNVSTSIKILGDNIAKLGNMTLPFTQWIASSPLLYPFLNPKGNQQIDGFVRRDLTDEMPEHSQMEIGCMTEVLNQIACLNQKSKIHFTTNKVDIGKTIQAINENNLNLPVLMEGDKETAINELARVFEGVDGVSVTNLRKKCLIHEGELVLKADTVSL